MLSSELKPPNSKSFPQIQNPLMNRHLPNGQQPGKDQIQLPTRKPATLKRFKVEFVFDHPAAPGGDAVVVAADMPAAAGIFFAQVHNIDLPIKQATFRAMDDSLISPASILPHMPG